MENNQPAPAAKSCCKTEDSRCRSKRCCGAKLFGGVLVLALVAGIAFCAGSKQAQADNGKPGTKLAAQEVEQIPVLRP